MSANSSSNENSVEISSFETQLSGRRWILIGCIFLQNILFGISFYAFGLNNDIFSEYFDTSYTLIDWFTIVNKPAKWLTCVTLAFLTSSNKVGFRKIAILAALLALIGSSCQLMAYLFPFLIILIYIGNFLLGILGGILLVIPISFAVLWFPDDEIGSAISIKIAGGRIGFLLASLVPSHILTPFINKRDDLGPEFDKIATSNTTQLKKIWMDDQKQKLLTYQGTIVAIAAVTLIFLINFALDQPPKPPTIAQARLRLSEKEQDKTKVWETLKKFLKETKSLFSDVTIVLLVILMSIVYGTSIYQTLFLSEIMRPIFQIAFTSSRADVISSYLVVAFQFGAFFSTIVAGLLVDRIKNYVLLARIGLACSVLCSIGLTVSYHYSNVPMIFLTNILLGMCAPAVATPLFELSTQHTYPRKTQFVVACLTSGFIPVEIALIEIGRVILDRIGGLSLLVYQVSQFFIAVLLTFFLKPRYLRLEAEINNDRNDVNQAEAEPLLLH